MDNAAATLVGSISSGDTSLTVRAEDVINFPTAPFNIVIDAEIITVGAVGTLTFETLTRGVNHTQAASHDNDAKIYNADISTMFQSLGTIAETFGKLIESLA